MYGRIRGRMAALFPRRAPQAGPLGVRNVRDSRCTDSLVLPPQAILSNGFAAKEARSLGCLRHR